MELAVVLIPLLMLLFSIATFGQLYVTKLKLNQGAREAARTLAVHNDDPDLDLLGGLTALVNDTLDEVLGEELHDALDVKAIVECTAGDAVVTLGTNEPVALPFLDIGGEDGQVELLAEATMRCEG